ncbi:MAG: class I SAM-dependent methyltransferase [Bauldia sp.]|nr:class I SAM-dependent methyltransferase [Bauldia sp.]
MANEPYGEDFSAAYAGRWDGWVRLAWPLITPHLPAGGSRWLDLCCGSGTLLRMAGGLGYAATGVDRSRHQLATAARKAPGARLVEGDVARLALRETFDVVTCLFDSLNYLVGLADLDRALAGARRHLAAGGVFLFDVKTADGFRRERPRAYRDSDRVTMFEPRFDEKRKVQTLLVTGFVREGELFRRFEEEHVQRGYEHAFLARRLDRAGFVHTAMDFDTGGEIVAGSGRLFFVCRPR